MRALSLLFMIGFMAAGSGCSNWSLGNRKYQTIVADPRRDEAGARAKTEQAAKAFHRNHIRKAEELLQEALVLDVEYGPAHNDLGLLYFFEGRYYLAAWEFEYAKQFLPARGEPFNNLGQVMEAVDRLDVAVENYQQACELDSTNAEFIGNLARALIKRDDHDAYAKEVLAELLMHETRPDWIGWARERLATGKFTNTTSTSSYKDFGELKSDSEASESKDKKSPKPEAIPTPAETVPPTSEELELPPPQSDPSIDQPFSPDDSIERR
jgi:Tfp pilus assembly protein PilF